MLLEVLSSNYPARHIGSTLVELVLGARIMYPARAWIVWRGTVIIQTEKRIR